MNAKDWLDYGGMGIAALTVVSSLAFARWALGRAFEMMAQANAAFSRMAQAINPVPSRKEDENDAHTD